MRIIGRALLALAGLALVVPALLALAVWAFWPRPVNWEPVFDVAVAAGDCEKANAILAAAREARYLRAIEIHAEGPPETCAHALPWPERYAEPARVLYAIERNRQYEAKDDAQRRIWARKIRARRRVVYSWPERLMDLSVDDVLEPICERPFRPTSYAQHAEMKRRLQRIQGRPLWFDANAFAYEMCGRAQWMRAQAVCEPFRLDFSMDCYFAAGAAARFDVRDAMIWDAIHGLALADRGEHTDMAVLYATDLHRLVPFAVKGDPDAAHILQVFWCPSPRSAAWSRIRKFGPDPQTFPETQGPVRAEVKNALETLYERQCAQKESGRIDPWRAGA